MEVRACPDPRVVGSGAGIRAVRRSRSTRIGGKVSVAQVAEIRPGTRVTLTGNFVQRYREDYYRFRDETGEILVEVDRRLWRNRLIGPHTPVQVTGEVERSLLRGRHVEADALVVLAE